MDLLPENMSQTAELLMQQLPQLRDLAEEFRTWVTQQITKLSVMPQRVVLCIFGLLAIVNAYTMRLSVDVAMAKLIPPKKTNQFSLFINKKSAVPRSLNIYDRLQEHKFAVREAEKRSHTSSTDGYTWSEQMQTIIMIAFYLGYVVTHVPGARMAEKYGGKWVLAVGIAITAVLTILTPTAIKWGGPLALILVRILMGLCEGPTFPAIGELLSKWVPAKERGTLGALVLSGSQIGISAINFLSSFLLHYFDWSMVFYYFGAWALLWFVAFTTLCYNEPATNPFIKEGEKQYLTEEIGIVRENFRNAVTPWKDILHNWPVLALISATVQYDWSQLQNIAEVPQILTDAERPLSENLVKALHNAVPYFVNWVISVGAGFASDLLVNYEILSVTVTRKIMTFVAAAVPNLWKALHPCMSCNKDLYSFFDCAIDVLGTYYAGIKLTPLDLSPNYAATIMAIANGLGSTTGIISPEIREELNKSTLFKAFRALLWVISASFISGDVQPFNERNNQSVKND